MPIEDLGLSVRTFNCLKRSGITNVGQILQMDRKELLGVRNFGQKSFDELQDALAVRGLSQPGGDVEGEEFAAERSRRRRSGRRPARRTKASIWSPARRRSLLRRTMTSRQ